MPHAPPPTMPPPPPLPEELLEEIFLRLPPDEPACLVRASLASKDWLALLTGPAFCSRYRDFHGAPPVLGFFHSWDPFIDRVEESPDPLFVSTKFRARIPVDDGEDGGWCYSRSDPMDCRHGRVVLEDSGMFDTKLVVLDPVTGRWWELDEPTHYNSEGAAVLCVAASCDHRSCHDGPFKVVFVGMDIGDGDSVAYAHESLPVTGESSSGLSAKWSKPCPVLHLGSDAWSKPCPGLHLGSDGFIKSMPPVLIQDALHFIIQYHENCRVGILKYDLRSKCLSLVHAPFAVIDIDRVTILMAMEDGSLGFAHIDGLTLNLWSRQMRSDGVGLWTECRVIHLKEFLPIRNPEVGVTLLGSVEGRDIILVSTGLGIYEISLKPLEWKKIWKSETFCALLPYISFYHP